MIERIQQLISKKELSATQFSDEIGVQRSSLSHVLSGRNKPSLDFMLKIKARFPEVNLDWLLLGEGEMFFKSSGSVGFLDLPETDTQTIREPSISQGSPGSGRRFGPVIQPSGYKKKSGEDLEYLSEIESKELKQVLLIFHDDTFRIILPEKK